MYLKKLIAASSVLIILLQIISCSDQKDKNADKGETAGEIEELQNKIKLDTIKSVKLSEKAQRKTEEWIMYIALNSEIKSLESYTIQDAIDNSSTLESVVDSLSKTVPDIFDTNAINSRVITLKTHAKLLEENSGRIEPIPANIENLSAKLKLDFNNLNIQLNEVFIIDEDPEGGDKN